MNTVEKGDSLEDQWHSFLIDQQEQGDLVFDAYPAALCEVHKKKKYYCRERQGDVEFDVVIEVRRPGREEPHLFVLFECKNHRERVQERDITDFSDKIGRIFGHSAKGVIVSASRLQSGAENVARSRRLGIIKYDINGVDIVADRTVGVWAENHFVRDQILETPRRLKSLKFSAYSDGSYFASLTQLLNSFQSRKLDGLDQVIDRHPEFVAFVPSKEIQSIAQGILSHADCFHGAVNVEKICSDLSIALSYSTQELLDSDGSRILGSANFSTRSIEVYRNDDPNRERFTIAHEIGHFCLKHDRYLRSEAVVESDLIANNECEDGFNYDRLEYQANLFASLLLLPEAQFRQKVDELRCQLGIEDRGHGYIFVDDQPCNYAPYNMMLSALSDYFGASKLAIEIRLKRMALVTDHRTNSRLSKIVSSGA